MVLGTLLPWLFLLSPFAQLAGQPSEPQTFTVRGTVVNSATGEPIRGALVQLYSGPTRSRLTGPQGEFVFENVPQGIFSVRVQKPGFFFSSELPPSNGQPSMITSGPDQPPAILKLIPEGLIFGRITGDNGEPVESLPVQLLVESMENGKKTRSFFRGANTDEQGEFRLAELPPGKYFIFFGPSSFPSSFSARLSQPGARGYPAAFYPGVPDIASATSIQITAGKRAEINLTISSQPFYSISGTVAGSLQNQGINLQITNAAGQPISSGFQFDPSRGTFRTQWLPAGPCTLTAEMQDPATQQEYFASQTLNLTSDVTGVHLVLLPNVSVPVNFRVETTRNDSPSGLLVVGIVSGPQGTQQRQAYIPGRVVLTPQNQTFSLRQRYSEIAPQDENSFFVRNVPPGVYSVEVFPNGSYYVQSVRSGSLNQVRVPVQYLAASSWPLQTAGRGRSQL